MVLQREQTKISDRAVEFYQEIDIAGWYGFIAGYRSRTGTAI